MTSDQSTTGLVAILASERAKILRYLVAHGAGDSAEDLLQELSIRLRQQSVGPIGSPLSYIYRAATHLMIDHRRSLTQSRQRDRNWAEVQDRTSDASDSAPNPERIIDARAKVSALDSRLDELPQRARRILLMHRVEGAPQRKIAERLGISVSTVEADLRAAYALLDAFRRDWDKADGQ